MLGTSLANQTRNMSMTFLKSRISQLATILALVAAGGIPCLIQFYTSDHSLDNANDEVVAFNEAFLSTQVQTSLLLSVLITVPMILEMFFDGLTIMRATSLEKISWFTRGVLILCMTVPNAILLTVGNDSQDSEMAYLCATAFINNASRVCLLIFLSQDHYFLGIGQLCIMTAIFYWIGVFSALAVNVDNLQFIRNFSLFFIILAYCQFLYIFYRLGTDLYRSQRKYDSNDVSAVVYFIGLVLIGAGESIIDRNFRNEPTPASLSQHIYLKTFFLVIITALPSQVAKFNLRKFLRKMEEKEAFIRYISHEIRTPLNTVFLGMSYIKGELMGIAPLVSEYVEPIIDTVNEVNNCCEVALSIVNDLLTFDKLEEGKMALELKETEIEKYVSETVKLFDIQAKQKNIMITVTAQEENDSNWTTTSVLRVDQNKMSQVIRNLISNAIKFTPDTGTITVKLSAVKVFVRANNTTTNSLAPRRLSVSNSIPSPVRETSPTANKSLLNIMKFPRVEESEVTLNTLNTISSSYRIKGSSMLRGAGEFADYLRIEVKDSGAGISEENQKRLFGQYVQFNAGKLQQGNGSGLGLYISKGITELHGGCIGAASEGEGKGSTFFLELPLFPKDSTHQSSKGGMGMMSKGRAMMSQNVRRESYSMHSVGIHPHGSGMNQNISIADLVSLNRKIQRRNNSSEFIYNSEYNDKSENTSCKSDLPVVSLDSFSERSDSSRFSGAVFVIGKKLSLARDSLKGMLDQGPFASSRVGCEMECDRELSGSGSGSGPGSRPGPFFGPGIRARENSVPALKVLIVDDSMTTRKILSQILKKEGYFVQCAEDGLACLSIVDKTDHKDAFDVIIMDDNMPNMSGRDATKRLRERGFRGMICGVTGNTSLTDTLAFEAHGATVVLPKPLDMKLFTRKINAHMKNLASYQ